MVEMNDPLRKHSSESVDQPPDGLRDAAPMNKAGGGSKRKVGTNCPDLDGTPRTNAPQSELEELSPLQELMLYVVKLGEKDFGLDGVTEDQIFAGVKTLQALIHQESQKAVRQIVKELKVVRHVTSWGDGSPMTLDEFIKELDPTYDPVKELEWWESGE